MFVMNGVTDVMNRASF